MSSTDPGATPPAITASELLAALEAAGFTVHHEVTGSHARMSWPHDAPGRRSIVVPLDPARPNHQAALDAILADVSDTAAAGRSAQDVLSHLYAQES